MAALLPGRGKTAWLEMRLGTGWWGVGGWCKGCCTGLGVWRLESLSFSAGKGDKALRGELGKTQGALAFSPQTRGSVRDP